MGENSAIWQYTKLTFEKSDREGTHRGYKSISRIKFRDPRGRGSLRADAFSAELYFSMRLKYLRILAAGEHGNGWPSLLLAKSACSSAKLLPIRCSWIRNIIDESGHSDVRDWHLFAIHLRSLYVDEGILGILYSTLFFGVQIAQFNIWNVNKVYISYVKIIKAHER